MPCVAEAVAGLPEVRKLVNILKAKYFLGNFPNYPIDTTLVQQTAVCKQPSS